VGGGLRRLEDKRGFKIIMKNIMNKKALTNNLLEIILWMLFFIIGGLGIYYLFKMGI